MAYLIRFIDNQGNPQQISKSGFSLKKEAQAAALEIEAKLKEGYLVSRNVGFVEYYEEWLETYKLGKHSRTTEVRYRTIKKQIEGYFGRNALLKDIRRSDWQRFINFFGENHAKETVSKLNGYIRDMVNSAIADRIIQFNFTTGVVL